ncbi:MAG: hypothetical protein ABIQ58_04640 [Candidatus Limnocylindrales bacterium]
MTAHALAHHAPAAGGSFVASRVVAQWVVSTRVVPTVGFAVA